MLIQIKKLLVVSLPKRNELKENEVDWIKVNFYKTYLIMFLP